jgi:iron-sulfur cluster assembly accessory protein
MNEVVNLDEKAAKMVREFIDGSDSASESENEVFLRVQIRGGGCAGFQYHLILDQEKENDLLFESFNEKVIIDPESFEFVKGSTITYTDGLNGSGFEVLNPRAKSACGCGSSFTLDDQGCDQGVY